MGLHSAHIADRIKEEQALHPAEINNIYYPVGTLLHVDLQDDERKHISFYATVVDNYEHYINVKVDGKTGNYIRSLNKVDIARKDGINIRRVK